VETPIAIRRRAREREQHRRATRQPMRVFDDAVRGAAAMATPLHKANDCRIRRRTRSRGQLRPQNDGDGDHERDAGRMNAEGSRPSSIKRRSFSESKSTASERGSAEHPFLSATSNTRT
jgi:hypothetical protein